jgi:pimeloyl-ACP methyl ester carboxylesterase
MSRLASLVALALAMGGSPALAAEPKPTVVLVHGAFAESSSWDGVIADLIRDGYPVLAAANPLRGAAGDAAYLASVVRTVAGPVILVGHSYGGTVISQAAVGASNVKALVYVAAFAPELGESSEELTVRFPGSTLLASLAPPVKLPSGSDEFYIRQDRFPAQFAADLPLARARRMAAAQRPATTEAFEEKATGAAWKTIPSWSIYGSADRNIPAAALGFMAQRAQARKVVVVAGASHVVMVSHPHDVSALIETAAKAR